MNVELSEVSDWLRTRSAHNHAEIIKPMPRISQDDNGEWSLDEDVDEASIYEAPFDGSDADAETIEELTGLSFLGEATEEYPEQRNCCISGNPTKRRILLSRTY